MLPTAPSQLHPPPPSGALDDGAGGEPTPVPAPDVASVVVETARGRAHRHARRARLYGYAIFTVALAAVVIALAASNTAHAKVSWVFGSSHVSLVWMVLAAAVLGWLLGMLTATVLRRRTRAPR